MSMAGKDEGMSIPLVHFVIQPFILQPYLFFWLSCVTSYRVCKLVHAVYLSLGLHISVLAMLVHNLQLGHRIAVPKKTCLSYTHCVQQAVINLLSTAFWWCTHFVLCACCTATMFADQVLRIAAIGGGCGCTL